VSSPFGNQKTVGARGDEDISRVLRSLRGSLASAKPNRQKRLSPYLLGALEDLEHARELSERGRPIDCKYAVISAASSIENALKEKVRTLGIPLTGDNPPYPVVGYADAVAIFKERGIKIPLENETRQLQRARNDCIHRSYRPDLQSTRWYVEVARSFVEEFCKAQLGVDIKELEVVESPARPQPIELIHKFGSRKALSDGRYVDAIMSGGIYLDKLMENYAVSRGLNKKYAKRQELLEFIRTKSRDLAPDMIKSVTRVRVIRGELSRGRSLPLKEEADFVVDSVEAVGTALAEVWTKEGRCSLCGKSDIAVERKEGSAKRLYCSEHAEAGSFAQEA